MRFPGCTAGSGSDEIYFLSNPQDEPVGWTVTVRAKGNVVQLFDPLDGSSRDLPEKSVASGRPDHRAAAFRAGPGVLLVLRDWHADTPPPA